MFVLLTIDLLAEKEVLGEFTKLLTVDLKGDLCVLVPFISIIDNFITKIISLTLK